MVSNLPTTPPEGSGTTVEPSDEVLGRWPRALCAVIAIAAGAGGTIGDFKEGSNGGAASVLLALFAFFGYLAISGQRLSVLKVGDSEARFSKVTRVVEQVLEDPATSEQTKAKLADGLDEIRPELPV